MGRPKLSEELLQSAVNLVQEKEYSIRKAAKTVGISATATRTYLKRIQSNAKSKQAKVRELRFIPTFDFQLIPRYLFEQIKTEGGWNIDRLYNYGQEVAKNPCTILFSMVDSDFHIKGFVWAALNPLRETIGVLAVSVDKEYQDRGEPLRYVGEFLNQIKEATGFKLIEWVTSKPHAFERLGAKRTKQVVMTS